MCPACFVCGRQAGGMPYITRVEPCEEIERDRSRKFWRVTESAFFRVVAAIKLLVSGLQDPSVDFAFSGSRLRFPQSLNYLAALLNNLVMFLFPGSRDSFEHLLEPGLTISVFWRKISSADKRFQIGHQPDAHWPAAPAGGCLDKRHVNPVNIGAFFPVHLNVHELPVHDRGHFFVLKRFVRHDMAPVTGGIAN